MRRILLIVCWQFGLLAGGQLFADVVVLNDGRQVSGSVESGNTQELHIKVGDQSQTIDIHEVQAIRFDLSRPEPPPTKAAEPGPAAPETTVAQPNNLILHDGSRVAGRWWSIDAADVHFLVNNQLQLYPRADVSGVTFGNATLPPPPARSTPPATSAQPAAGATQPSRAPSLAGSSAGPPQPPQPARSTPPPATSAQPAAGPTQPPRAPTLAGSSAGPQQSPTLARPSGAAPPAEPPRGQSQPDEIGMVYSWNGKVVIPLERSRAVQRGTGAAQYYEMPGPQSRVRLTEAPSLVFVVGLPQGIDPASYSLFPLDTVNGGRRTRSQVGRRGGLMTWPVDIVKKDDASIVTYVFTVRDLPVGEYSFSPSSSNDGYCFGVDPAPPGQ